MHAVPTMLAEQIAFQANVVTRLDVC